MCIRDRSASEEIKRQVDKLGREFVIQVKGKVVERASKNSKIPTGEIEILITDLTILSRSDIPPFTIEDNTDGGDEIRMKYRYLDLRRNMVRKNLELRHRMAHLVQMCIRDRYKKHKRDQFYTLKSLLLFFPSLVLTIQWLVQILP